MRSPAGTPARPRLPVRSVRGGGSGERMASDHDVRRSVGLQSTHWPQPGLEPAVIGLAPVILVLTGVVERGRDQLVDHFARAAVRSVMISVGVRCALRGAVKNLRAEAISLCWETRMSMTWPCWSTARYTYRQMPATLT